MRRICDPITTKQRLRLYSISPRRRRSLPVLCLSLTTLTPAVFLRPSRRPHGPGGGVRSAAATLPAILRAGRGPHHTHQTGGVHRAHRRVLPRRGAAAGACALRSVTAPDWFGCSVGTHFHSSASLSAREPPSPLFHTQALTLSPCLQVLLYVIQQMLVLQPAETDTERREDTDATTLGFGVGDPSQGITATAVQVRLLVARFATSRSPNRRDALDSLSRTTLAAVHPPRSRSSPADHLAAPLAQRSCTVSVSAGCGMATLRCPPQGVG
jgi:hypothetical protein